MLARRIKRDVAERGRSVEGVLDQFVPFLVDECSLLKRVDRYLRYVKPSFDNFVGPSAKYADIVCRIRFAPSQLNLMIRYPPGFRSYLGPTMRLLLS